MVSPTKQTERRRNIRSKNAGRARKNALATKGTTKSREELFKVVE